MNAPSSKTDRCIGTSEIAARLNCHPISIYRYLKCNREFPRARKIANKLAWSEAEVDEWIRRQPQAEAGK